MLKMLNRRKKSDKHCNNATDDHLYDASNINSVGRTAPTMDVGRHPLELLRKAINFFLSPSPSAPLRPVTESRDRAPVGAQVLVAAPRQKHKSSDRSGMLVKMIGR